MATIGNTPDALQQWRAAHGEALRLAQQLRASSAVFRQYAGKLKYHPQVGVQGHVGGDLVDAVAAVRDTLNAIVATTAQWDEESPWLRSHAHSSIDDIDRGQDEVREAVRLTRAALEIFQQAALHPEPASLDAPYGHGAPHRVHPGAQCTWVAERAEGLAIALSSVTLQMENLLRAAARTRESGATGSRPESPAKSG